MAPPESGVQAEQLASDSLQRVIEAVVAQPEYQLRAPTDALAPLRRAWLNLQDWIATLRTDNPLAYRLLVGALLVVLSLIVLHALWVAARTMQAGTAAVDRALPEAPRTPQDRNWYATEAARLASVGRYAEAMQADFVRLILEFDARELARFHPSKTPVEYVREARLAPEGRQEFRSLVRMLYEHGFAHVGTTEDAWTTWRSRAAVERYATA